jgi:hypothetical protein
MHDTRRWLRRWQRVELVELCLVQGLTRRQAAAWRRVSSSSGRLHGRFRPVRKADVNRIEVVELDS